MAESSAAPSWGEEAEPGLITPAEGAVPYTALTWDTLAWLSRNGLRPTVDWHESPQGAQIVVFGAGSGWLWGELIISHRTGAMRQLNAYWIDQHGKQRLSTVNGPNQLRRELAGHEAQREQRLIWLAARHGLIVISP